jgi:hypothetical protein
MVGKPALLSAYNSFDDGKLRIMEIGSDSNVFRPIVC